MVTPNYRPCRDPIYSLKQEMKLRYFSRKTVKSYLYYITDFLKKANKGPKDVNNKDIRSYLEMLADGQKSASTINTAYSALLFYFAKILRRKFFICDAGERNGKASAFTFPSRGANNYIVIGARSERKVNFSFSHYA